MTQSSLLEKDLHLAAVTGLIEGTRRDDTLLGTTDDDEVRGLRGNDTLSGMDGNDTLAGNDGDDTLYGGIGDDLLNGGRGHDRLYGDAGQDILKGGEGYDWLYGGAGNDRLNGGAGNDILVDGSSGDDRLDGGTGNDVMDGGGGNDTYIFGLGDGHDGIAESGFDTNDRILLKAGIAPDDITMTAFASNLTVTVDSTGDSLEISFFRNNTVSPMTIDKIEFADGTVWDQDYISLHYTIIVPMPSAIDFGTI